MQIQFPANLAASVIARVVAVLPWSVNDILLAEVVGKTAGNFTRLAIGDRLVMAHTDAPLVLGQKLALRVTATGTTTVMTVLPAAQKVEVGAVDRGLARTLPQQASAADTEQLLKIFDVLVEETRAVVELLGRAAAVSLIQDIKGLLQALPTPAQLSIPTQLRSAVEQVVVATESRLMNALVDDSRPDVAKDLRAQFARVGADLATLPATARDALEHVVQQALTTRHAASMQEQAVAPELDAALPTATSVEHHGGDLKTLVDSVVARLEANQLQTVANTPSNNLPLLVDLPVIRDGQIDLLHMEVDSEECQADAATVARTSVTLNLRLDGGHEFSARLQLSGESLSVRLGASDATFNHQLAQRVGELELGLKAAGLTVSQIFIAPLAVSSRPRVGACQLVNERV